MSAVEMTWQWTDLIYSKCIANDFKITEFVVEHCYLYTKLEILGLSS